MPSYLACIAGCGPIPLGADHLAGTECPACRSPLVRIYAPHPSAPHPSAPHPSAPHPSAPRPSAPKEFPTMPTPAPIPADPTPAPIPADPTPAPSADLAAPAPAAVPDTAPLAHAVLRRDKGKLVLALDLAPLHSYLDALGVEKEEGYKRYANAPTNGSTNINTSTNEISPALLCSWTADPETGAYRPFVEISISALYGRPPTAAVLNAILDSLWNAVHAVVEHYRPVTISVTVHASVGKGVSLSPLSGATATATAAGA